MSQTENPTPEIPQASETPEPRPAEPTYAPPPPPPPTQAAVPPPPTQAPFPQKTPILAGILSVVPGLGHVYNGLYPRAVAFFLIYVTFFALSIDARSDGERAVLIPCMVFFWLFNLFDAYRQATLINYGYTSSTLPRPANGDLRSVAFVPGVALIAVGVYGLLRRYLDFDLRWILDQWPFLLILFGGFMIYQGVKGRRDETAESEI